MQAGAAAILLVAFIVLGSLYALLAGVNSATAEIGQRRDARTQDALRQAKEGLVAWAARRSYQPGALPCPDTNGDGYADTDIAPADGVADTVPSANADITRHSNNNAGGFCSTPQRRIGRLPWRTLGLADLRDADGEQLWYAVSDSFRALPTREINSDTPGQLAVVSTDPPAPAARNPVVAGVIAILFSPGTALAGQDRTGGPNQAANYLEDENAGATDDVFVAGPRCERADCAGGAFNDRLALVTADDFFPLLETVVEARIAASVKPALQEYFSGWAAAPGFARGFYPFAAPYDDGAAVPADPGRSRTFYLGAHGQLGGLLPVSEDSTQIGWAPAPPVGGASWPAPVLARDTAASTGPGDFSVAPTCSPGPQLISCSFTYQGDGMAIVLTARYANAAQSFALPLGATDVTIAGPNPVAQSFQHSLDSQGHLDFTYRAALQNTAFPAPVTIQLTIPRSRLVAANDAATGWFVRNGWFRQTYYALSAATSALPGAALPCDEVSGAPALPPPNPCVRVENLLRADRTVDPDNGRKWVVLVLAGNRLSGGARSYADGVARYFERENASWPTGPSTASNHLFRRDPRTALFNDKVVVVAP